MIRGDYIHHGLPEKHKNTGGGAGESFHRIARRVGLLGGVWSEKWGGYLEKMALLPLGITPVIVRVVRTDLGIFLSCTSSGGERHLH